jgi:hypothetical protein
MKRLLILACSATKDPAPGYMTALERYRGPLWLTLKAVDPKGELARVAVLSARYGFNEARWLQTQPYDTRLTAELAERMIAGGIGKRWPEYGKGGMGGMHAAAEAHSMTLTPTLDSEPFDDVALCGGALYIDVMRAFLGEFQRAGYVEPDAQVTTICTSIGFMRRELRDWLLTPPIVS